MSGTLFPDMPPTDDDPLGGLLPGTTGAVDPAAQGVAGSAGLAAGTGTGQHGVLPLTGAAIGGGMGSAICGVWNWLNEPFTTPLSPSDLFMIIGVILIAIIIWNLILYHVRIAAEAL